MSDTETCPKKVWSGDPWSGRYAPCGKAVKRDGLCGIHARSKDREAERKARRDRVAATTREARTVAQEFAAAGYEVSWDAAGVCIETEVARRLLRDLMPETEETK